MDVLCPYYALHYSVIVERNVDNYENSIIHCYVIKYYSVIIIKSFSFSSGMFLNRDQVIVELEKIYMTVLCSCCWQRNAHTIGRVLIVKVQWNLSHLSLELGGHLA